MTDFGGTGGVEGGRRIDYRNPFEALLVGLFGEQVRESDVFAAQLWSALSNIVWEHENGDTAWFSFRRAGDVIAAIREEGDYLHWYCNGRAGIVSEEIAEKMKAHGWTWKEAEA